MLPRCLGVKYPKFIKERQLKLFALGNNSQHLLFNINRLLLVILPHVRVCKQVHHKFDTKCTQYITDIGLQVGLQFKFKIQAMSYWALGGLLTLLGQYPPAILSKTG